MKRYFFIAGVPHESESGGWMKAKEIEAEIAGHKEATESLLKEIHRLDEEIKRLRKALESINICSSVVHANQIAEKALGDA